MSFGYGVGDCIVIAQLAWKLYQNCQSAPKNFQDIAKEVHGLHLALTETNRVVSTLEQTLGPEREDQLRTIASGCRDVLVDLEETLAKFDGFRNGAARLRDRFWWAQDDVEGLRARLVSNVVLLTDFKMSIQLCVLPIVS